MEYQERRKKKITVALIAIAGFIVVASIVFFIFKPRPSCLDGIQNQNENGIDCGGPCFPCEEKVTVDEIEVQEVEYVYDIDNKYDVVATIKNPNELYGAASFQYYAIFENGRGEELNRSAQMNSFILPKEEKMLIAHGVSSTIQPARVRVVIENVMWEKFVEYEAPRLSVISPVYNEISDGYGFAKLSGTLVNKTSIDFEEIKVKVLLRDHNNALIATNYQVMNTVRTGEQRDFLIVFPHEFPGSVNKIDIEAETNVFDSSNYLNSYGEPERWEPEKDKYKELFK